MFRSSRPDYIETIHESSDKIDSDSGLFRSSRPDYIETSRRSRT